MRTQRANTVPARAIQTTISTMAIFWLMPKRALVTVTWNSNAAPD
ncbi:hypothetical protein [Xanthomonas oryzae]|uniref:Uncharacterized protein n=1 Tax=Xanthomonas oryzae pv. leersiae TaxID=3112258 RepID=A0AAJ6H1G4_9XANT|nr:hypothetical protein [Xanthomonas oryzae]WIX08735.1 hypothetical protein QN060_15375 [Xanthomonas oryzae pv. oryzae]